MMNCPILYPVITHIQPHILCLCVDTIHFHSILEVVLLVGGVDAGGGGADSQQGLSFLVEKGLEVVGIDLLLLLDVHLYWGVVGGGGQELIDLLDEVLLWVEVEFGVWDCSAQLEYCEFPWEEDVTD